MRCICTENEGERKTAAGFFYVLLSLNVLSSSAWWVITIVTTQMEGSVTMALSTAARWISDDTLLNAYFLVTNGNIIKIYTWKTHLVLFLPSINIVWLFIFVFLLTFTLCSVLAQNFFWQNLYRTPDAGTAQMDLPSLSFCIPLIKAFVQVKVSR